MIAQGDLSDAAADGLRNLFNLGYFSAIEILADSGSPRRQRIMALIANSCVLAFFVLLTVLSVNYIGDGLRDAMDPRIRGR